MSTLCRMVINTDYENLPASVIDHAKKSLLNIMAVTIGGSAMEGIRSVVDLVKEKEGKPESFIPFYGGKVPASEAGLAIGPMSRAMDMGDIHEEDGFSSSYTFPALLAATGLRARISGREFIAAFVVGQEVMIRIGIAYKGFPRGAAVGGGPGHFIFGPVASVGKLLGLSLEELENAQGIARTMTQPHDASMYSPATLMVRVHHGFVCQDAINACLLARKGITGPRNMVLSAPKGFLGMARWETEPGVLTRGLGEEWETANVIIKPYACCMGAHTAIDALLDQMREHNFKADDISHIDVEESSLTWGVFQRILSDPNPQTVEECQFNLYYVVAAAAYDKDVLLDSFTPEARARQNARELMARISVREDSGLRKFAARVNITLKDGRKYSKECAYLKGHPRNPFTEQELVDKFKKCVPFSAYKLTDKAVDSMINALLNLEKVDDVVSDLIVPLTPKERTN
ncbi:MAG: MmgE/PrpD family protein [Chloroflexi bacterium]|nr:MmgE/PrpD family protein [Chloroflexota bacterium]